MTKKIQLSIAVRKKALRRLARKADQKDLALKVWGAGWHFFGPRGTPRALTNAEFFIHRPWKVVDGYPLFDLEVIVPRTARGHERLSIRLMNTIRRDVCAVALVGAKGERTIVLSVACARKDSNDPRAVNGYLYETYRPGAWESSLNGPELERLSRSININNRAKTKKCA